jgi:MoxR-like ATPase
MDIREASDLSGTVLNEIEEAVIVDREFLETVLTGILAEGHVLLEDVPGTGKTLTARSLATALGLDFKRIQFTPDLLPSDVTGSHIYNKNTSEFEFREGPIFSNIVLADEINRAPPKTQAALLEAMEEKQVSTEGETRSLPSPFFVIATQNPVEQEGTFELPEAQRDRFMIKTRIGYPERSGELALLERRDGRSDRIPEVTQVVERDNLSDMQATAEDVTVDKDIMLYITDLCRQTREHDATDVGVSPRGIQQLFEAVRAQAVLDASEFVKPKHVTTVARSVLSHRLVLKTDAAVRGTNKIDVIADVLDEVEVPGVVDSE